MGTIKQPAVVPDRTLTLFVGFGRKVHFNQILRDPGFTVLLESIGRLGLARGGKT
jgi:hypothetical protein